MFPLKKVVLIWGNLLITRGFKTFIKERQQCRGDHKQKVATLVTDFLNPQSKSLLYRDTIKLHFDRFVHMQALPAGALYFFFDNKEDLFKNVLIPVTEGAIQILEDYKDHLLVSGERNLEDTPLGDKETLEEFLDLLYGNRYVAQILVNNRENPHVAYFFEELTEVISATIRAILYPNIAQVNPMMSLIITWLATN